MESGNNNNNLTEDFSRGVNCAASIGVISFLSTLRAESSSCSHGAGTSGCPVSASHQGHHQNNVDGDGDDDDDDDAYKTRYYPNTKRALFIMKKIWVRVVDAEDNRPDINLILYDITTVIVDFLNQDLVKSCVMIGTDLLCCSCDDDADKQVRTAVATYLAVVISLMEGCLGSELCQGKGNGMSVLEIQGNVLNEFFMNLDNMYSLVRFFDGRNTCSCLDQAKEQHKTRMGVCRNMDCLVSCRDTKLHECSGCRLVKYCCKDCQITDWPNHKKFCKDVQKNLRTTSKKTNEEGRS